MTIQQAKEMDMVDYLSRLGHEPEKISNKSYWYISPLREEKTPSFKVNRVMNRWYDFAEGKGGNLVDFGTLYHQCSVSDFLQKLVTSGLVIKQHENVVSEFSLKKEKSKQINIISVHEVSSYPLMKYMRSRRIADEIAAKYLKEVRYTSSDKTYYALGFKNDAGGYELRNENFKGSSSPKDISFIYNGAKDVAVFEGFFNFLSHRTMFYNQEEPTRNFLVLNTASFFEKSILKMMEHERVHLYLDNDKTGQKCTQQALALDNKKFQDERKLYQKYDDLEIG
ncbi:MAG: toprim domain-containing protein [Ferruginibacter sp.]